MDCIELMIVVAIIGILAAIAIPQYQNYIAKSQVSRVMSETGSMKTVVEDCILNGKTASNACELGWTKSNLLGAAQTTGDLCRFRLHRRDNNHNRDVIGSEHLLPAEVERIDG